MYNANNAAISVISPETNAQDFACDAWNHLTETITSATSAQHSADAAAQVTQISFE